MAQAAEMATGGDTSSFRLAQRGLKLVPSTTQLVFRSLLTRSARELDVHSHDLEVVRMQTWATTRASDADGWCVPRGEAIDLEVDIPLGAKLKVRKKQQGLSCHSGLLWT